MPPRPPLDPFTARLRDLLSTLESAALRGVAEARGRGRAEHLRFACLAVPCSEALVALEVAALGHLSVPVVADARGERTVGLDFWPSGTPFAYLLAGGGGYAVELQPDDPLIAPLRLALAASPRSAIFVPLHAGGAVVGGAALFAHEARLGDRELDLAERLGAVLSLTVEAFRTERALFELFARALPDVLGPDAQTSLPAALERHLAALRAAPAYRRRLTLAAAVERVAAHGPREAELAAALLDRLDAYARGVGEAP
jgi:GAF domain-containing protein